MKKASNNSNTTLSQSADVMQVITPLTLAYKEIMQNAFPNSQEIKLNELENFAKLVKLTNEEAAIVVMLYVKQESKVSITLKELAVFLAPILRITHRMVRTEIRNLMSLGVISYAHDEDGRRIELSHEAIHAIDKGELKYFQNIGPNGLERMLEFCYKNLFEHHRISTYALGETFDEMESQNPNLEIIKYLQSQYMFAAPEELFTFLGVITHGFLMGDSFSYFNTMENLQTSITRKMQLKSTIKCEQWAPISDGYIEIDGSGFRDDTPDLKITEKGFDKFLGELGTEALIKIRSNHKTIKTPLIQPNSIETTQLYFSRDLQNQLDRITKILSEDRFKEYQSKVPGKMKGLTMLLYGSPGCGKTEFVLQLAKQTQRPIMKIEISDILDKWVGESEKNIKNIFRDYQRAKESLSTEPILFFNEADQLISKRLQAKNGADQMINGMQNLLLEAMENFNGILIGTTNLESQMDSAFERRWVLKVNFTNPEKDAQIKIWQSHITELSVSEVEELATEFPLNPGEIHNVVKRWNIEVLLGTSEEPLVILKRLCSAERFLREPKQNIIGFDRAVKAS